MSTPSPALVSQDAVRRLPALALVLFVLTYVMAGFWGREPWKTIDMSSLGVMLALVQEQSPWWAPSFLGSPPEVPALLPYWLGAWALLCSHEQTMCGSCQGCGQDRPLGSLKVVHPSHTS